MHVLAVHYVYLHCRSPQCFSCDCLCAGLYLNLVCETAVEIWVLKGGGEGGREGGEGREGREVKRGGREGKRGREGGKGREGGREREGKGGREGEGGRER